MYSLKNCAIFWSSEKLDLCAGSPKFDSGFLDFLIQEENPDTNETTGFEPGILFVLYSNFTRFGPIYHIIIVVINALLAIPYLPICVFASKKLIVQPLTGFGLKLITASLASYSPFIIQQSLSKPPASTILASYSNPPLAHTVPASPSSPCRWPPERIWPRWRSMKATYRPLPDWSPSPWPSSGCGLNKYIKIIFWYFWKFSSDRSNGFLL